MKALRKCLKNTVNKYDESTVCFNQWQVDYWRNPEGEPILTEGRQVLSGNKWSTTFLRNDDYEVHSVKLKTSSSEGISNAVVSVDGKYCGRFPAETLKDSYYIVKCETPQNGKAIEIQNDADRRLEFAELKAYGGKFDTNYVQFQNNCVDRNGKANEMTRKTSDCGGECTLEGCKALCTA